MGGNRNSFQNNKTMCDCKGAGGWLHRISKLDSSVDDEDDQVNSDINVALLEGCKGTIKKRPSAGQQLVNSLRAEKSLSG